MSWEALRHLPALLRWQRVVHLTLFVTRRCNSRCAFCFYRHDATISQDQDTWPEMDLGEYMLLSRQVGKLFWLALSGGEILLRDDLAAIIRVFYRRNRPAFILLPSNGLLPERLSEVAAEVATDCPASTVTVKLSLDGPAAVHDRLRGVDGAYERVIASCRQLEGQQKRHENLEVGFNTVLLRDTLPVIDQTMAQVRQLAPALPHTLSLFRGDISGGQLFAVPADAYRGVAAKFETQQRTAGNRYRFSGARVKAALDEVVHQRILSAMESGERKRRCAAGSLSLTVTENGGVYPCEDFSMGMGNLRQYDHDLGRLLASPCARQILRQISERRCQCTHECYHMLNGLAEPLGWPALLWRSFRHRGGVADIGTDGSASTTRTESAVPGRRL